jgi:hypothetical protein
MAIKNIMTPILGRDGDEASMEAAGHVAMNNYAHVDAVFLHRDPKRQIIPQIGEGASSSMIEPLARSAEKTVVDAREKARAFYESWVGNPAFQDSAATSSWHEISGEIGETIASHGRLADLVCVVRGSGHSDPDRDAIIEAALMQTGRAALVLPPNAPATIGKKIAIAWNGSKEASRAVAMTMPLLETAESVTVNAELSDMVTQADAGGMVEA